MNDTVTWKKKIINALIEHYFSAAGIEEKRSCLRIRSSVFFPDFETAHPDNKVSYLEAAESLESKGIIKLRWEKHNKGEQLKTLSCENFEALFTEAGKPYPEIEAEKIRARFTVKINELKNIQSMEKIIPVLEYFSLNFSPREIGQGLDQQSVEDIIRLLVFSSDRTNMEKITMRAQSILLYNDSKHLEYLLELCTSLLSRAQKNIAVPDFNFPDRSFPEAAISGKLIFELRNTNTPLVNAEGIILNLPLESTHAIAAIKPLSEISEKKVLTIENKETFYALGSSQNKKQENNFCYDCFLNTGGYPNRAVASLIKTLAISGFSFYHTGDLDPDGVLILQNIQDIINSTGVQKIVTPIRMDVVTFDQYRSWAKPLTRSILNQIKKIREETRNIPELAGLLQRIEETQLGVEQEIIDYR